MDEVKEQLRAVLAEDELFALGAQMLKKSYDAMVAAGFTPDQAVTLLAGQGLKGLLAQ